MMFALIIFLALFIPNELYINESVTLTNLQPLPKERLAFKYETWMKLCMELREMDCSGVSVPKVLTFSPVPSRPGLLGYYRGGDTIYVRSNIYNKALGEVLAHEMSHYYDVVKGLTVVPGEAKQICFSEKRAWAVSDAYNRVYGYPAAVVGKRWVNWYKHCRPFKNDLYPIMFIG